MTQCCFIVPTFTLRHALNEPVIALQNPRIARAIAATIVQMEALTEARTARVDPNPGSTDIYVFDAENGEDLPGKLVYDGGAPVAMRSTIQLGSDESVVRAKAFNARYLEFLKKRGRNSLDNRGVDCRAVVHYGKQMMNAFQTQHDGQPIMVYGDGDGKSFNDFTTCYDITGHENMHAVVGSTAGLRYFSMPGAINEHMADVSGVCAQHAIDGSTILRASWFIGADVIGPVLKEQGWKAIRTFENDKAYPSDPQPKHMKNHYWGVEDNGGVHINSGILNNAFRLFCLTSGFEFTHKEPFDIWYHALLKLHSLSHYWDLKKAVVAVSKEKYGKEVAAMAEKAFKAVGI